MDGGGGGGHGSGWTESEKPLLSAQTKDGSGEGQILLARMSDSRPRTLTARDITFPRRRGRRRDAETDGRRKHPLNSCWFATPTCACTSVARWQNLSYVFGPSGFWTMALLRYPAKFDPFLSLDCARIESVGAQSKER